MNRSGRFPASHYDRHGLRIRRALPLPLRERGHGPRERMRSAPRGRRVRTMPTAKSEKREAARGISEVERPFAKRTFLARPERPAAVDAVRAFFGVVSAPPTRRTLHPIFWGCLLGHWEWQRLAAAGAHAPGNRACACVSDGLTSAASIDNGDRYSHGQGCDRLGIHIGILVGYVLPKKLQRRP